MFALVALRKVSNPASPEDNLRLSFFAHDRIALALPHNDARVPSSKILSLLNGGIFARGRARIESR
ncbi:hypothetical protein D3C85_1836660 [compost metagenome]